MRVRVPQHGVCTEKRAFKFTLSKATAMTTATVAMHPTPNSALSPIRTCARKPLVSLSATQAFGVPLGTRAPLTPRVCRVWYELGSLRTTSVRYATRYPFVPSPAATVYRAVPNTHHRPLRRGGDPRAPLAAGCSQPDGMDPVCVRNRGGGGGLCILVGIVHPFVLDEELVGLLLHPPSPGADVVRVSPSPGADVGSGRIAARAVLRRSSSMKT